LIPAILGQIGLLGDLYKDWIAVKPQIVPSHVGAVGARRVEQGIAVLNRIWTVIFSPFPEFRVSPMVANLLPLWFLNEAP
jgi:membrane associated rhomboid family serine protease